MIRGIIIYIIIVGGEYNTLQKDFCETIVRETTINVSLFIVTELMPYLVIFILNFNNFRQQEKRNQYIESRY